MSRDLSRIFLILTAAIAALAITASNVRAEIQTKTVEYKDGDTVLEGYVAWDDTYTDDRPGILIVHQWMGLTDYEKSRAKQLADLGYVAFAVDVYGKGVRPADPKEAGKQAGIYKGDRDLYRRRLQVGLEELKKQKGVDASKIAAIGYCFGGTGVLELARSGADIAGVVSFHGGLDNPRPKDAANIKAKVLVFHGGKDPYVPQKDVDAFWKEMNTTNVDWTLTIYSDAVHAFTQKAAGNDPSVGAAYNERADRLSWEGMREFFVRIF
ncbi:dienelactone hydrolase family protein [bacterium]|nr:dienelactone hydrolase family protein [bacterium]